MIIIVSVLSLITGLALGFKIVDKLYATLLKDTSWCSHCNVHYPTSQKKLHDELYRH